MARTLKAGLQAVLDGGSTYWLCIIHANDADSWAEDKIAFGTIRTTSFADTTLWQDVLVAMSDIDTSGDPMPITGSPLAKIPDVNITLDNTSADILATDYIGRKIEIRMGYGTTMSEATSDIFFTGKIFDATPTRKDIVFKARGISMLRDKEIGERLPDTVDKKYRGQILPITHGDWTDEDAYAPLIVLNDNSQVPSIKMDNRPWKSFDELLLYDKDSLKSYRVTDETQFTINADDNLLEFVVDTTAKLTAIAGGAITPQEKTLSVDNNALITWYGGSGSSPAEQTIIKIDNELMLVVRNPVNITTGTLIVDRGYAGTTIATHRIGAVIYQATDIASFNILVNGIFYPKGFSGFEIDYQGRTDQTNEVASMLAYSDYLKYQRRLVPKVATSHNGVLLDMVFDSIGVSGAVVNHYVLIKARSKSEITVISAGDPYIFSKASICKDGAKTLGVVVTSAGVVDLIASASDPATAPFDNIPGGDGSDAETDLPMDGGAVEFTASGISVDPARTAVYSNNSNEYTIIYNRGLSAGSGTFICTRTSGTGQPESSGTLTKVSGTGDATITFSAFTGGSIKLDDISNLNSARYSIGFIFDYLGDARGYGESSVWQVGFRIDFKVNPLEFDFYARGEARENPGGYFNGSIGELIEAPSIVLEDFFRNDVQTMVAADLDETCFDSFHTERSAWKLATTIFSGLAA